MYLAMIKILRILGYYIGWSDRTYSDMKRKQAIIKIHEAISIDPDDIEERSVPEYLKKFTLDGKTIGIDWKSPRDSTSIFTMVNKYKHDWDRGMLIFQDQTKADEIFDQAFNEFPNFAVYENDQSIRKGIIPIDSISFSQMDIGQDMSALIFPDKLPSSFNKIYMSQLSEKCLKVSATNNTNNKEHAILCIGTAKNISKVAQNLIDQGAILDDGALASKFRLATTSLLIVTVSGCIVKIQGNLSNPLHHLLKPEQEFKWNDIEKKKLPVPWDGYVPATKATWPAHKEIIKGAGIPWEGDDPEKNNAIAATAFDSPSCSGWHSSIIDWDAISNDQKKGVRFCLNNNSRALIVDENQLGKKTIAVAVTDAAQSAPVLIICPPTSRSDWNDFITHSAKNKKILHIPNPFDILDAAARWHIVSYNQLVVPAVTWDILDEKEKNDILSANPEILDQIKRRKKYPMKITLNQNYFNTPGFADDNRVALWNKKIVCLKADLIDRILAFGYSQVIIDEAQCITDPKTKRTQAILRVAAGISKMLLLADCLIEQQQKSTLLELLDHNSAIALNKSNGYSKKDICDCLDQLTFQL